MPDRYTEMAVTHYLTYRNFCFWKLRRSVNTTVTNNQLNGEISRIYHTSTLLSELMVIVITALIFSNNLLEYDSAASTVLVRHELKC